MSQKKHSDTEGADSGTHTYHVSYCTVIVCTYVWALSIVYVKASYEYDTTRALWGEGIQTYM